MPPIGLLPSRRRWHPPFIYSPDDIAALLGAAAALPSCQRAAGSGQRAATLLHPVRFARRHRHASRGSVDSRWLRHRLGRPRYAGSGIEIGKSRNVHLSDSTAEALAHYASLRESFDRTPGNESYFISLTGRRMIYESVFEVFADLRRGTGIGPQSTVAPRIHDLRPTFAVTVCCSGTATATTSPLDFRGSPPTSVTATHDRPTQSTPALPTTLG